MASPLGAWLLLGLCASAGRGAVGEELAEVLGVPAGDATAAVAALLEHPHPLVSSATAVWHAPGRDTEGLRGWQAGLPAGTAVGVPPDQDGVDAWAREHTGGLIGAFPLPKLQEVVLLLASALATRVSWADPFEVAPAGALGAGSPWAARLTRVLRTPENGHSAHIAATKRAGDAIVHVVEADCADRSRPSGPSCWCSRLPPRPRWRPVTSSPPPTKWAAPSPTARRPHAGRCSTCRWEIPGCGASARSRR
ncbi:hypothetical protein [Actinoplanes sp. NPDC049599]|uniref:hypothetical protein n=1 Tax=Actinoplanes sp. NPDC049599 TaxID=3363903 RepID=UPI0037B248DB